MKKSTSLAGLGLLGAFALLVVWMLAPLPLFHSIMMIFLICWPFFALLVVLAVATFIIAGTTESAGLTLTCGTLSLVLLLNSGIIATGGSQALLVQSIEPDIIEQLPDTTNVRYMPMKIASQLAKNSYQDSQNYISDVDPFINSDGDVAWIGPRVPSSMWNFFVAKQQGVLTISPDGKITATDEIFQCGEGMGTSDSVKWALWRKHYTADIGDMYYANVKDQLVIVAPYISWRMSFPLMIPYWGGVMIVEPNCTVHDFTPQEALDNPDLKDVRLVPSEYAERVAKAWGYRNGVWNAWFRHVEQTELPTIDNEDNQMPYLLPVEGGQVWFSGLEPYGPVNSIYKAMLMDARTGKLSLYNFSKDAAIISPNKVGGFVRTTQPTYNWYTEGQGGNMVVIEPRPIIRQGELYWMVSTTSVDYSKVEATYLMRGSNQAIYEARSLSSVKAFLNGASLKLVSGEPTENSENNLEGLTDQQLIDIIQQAAEELKRRSSQSGG